MSGFFIPRTFTNLLLSSALNVPALAVIADLIYINNLLLELPGFFLDIYSTKINAPLPNPPLCT